MSTSRPKMIHYTEEAMLAACQALSREKRSIRETARLYGVPASTLRDRLKGKKAFHEVKRTVITADEEQRLVEWIKESARKGLDPTMTHVRRAVQTILNDRKAETVFSDNMPGRKWVSLFLKRHPDVTLRIPQALEAQQAAVTEAKLRAWFETAFKEIQTAGGDVLDHPSRIFNCDETAFQLGGSGLSRVMANKGNRRVSKLSKDTRTQITVLVCGSASGNIHNPLIVFPGQRFSYDPLEGFPEAHFAKSISGWIDGEIFTAWFKNVFIPATDHLPKPVLLFTDRHREYLTITVSELCRDHGIVLYQLPSHSSHLVQPLHLTFKLLMQVWRKEVLRFLEKNCDNVGKREFSAVLKKVWEHGIQKDAMISGFRAAGLYPWNPDHIDMTKLELSRLSNTKAETDSATVNIPTADTPKEMTGLAPRTTETETLTVTMTADQTKPLSINPPSPTTYPSALPPASLSSLPSCATTCTVSTSSYWSSPLVITPIVPISSSSSSSSSPSCADGISSSPFITVSSSSHITSTSTAPTRTVASSSSSFSMINNSTQIDLDRLLDMTALVGTKGLIRYRTLQRLGIETDDPEERLFCLLYTKLIGPQQTDTLDCAAGQTVGSLRLTSQTLQPPRVVNVTGTDTRKMEEDKKSKKKERKEKRKRMEGEKEKKRQERERKKRKREELKAEKREKC